MFSYDAIYKEELSSAGHPGTDNMVSEIRKALMIMIYNTQIAPLSELVNVEFKKT